MTGLVHTFLLHLLLYFSNNVLQLSSLISCLFSFSPGSKILSVFSRYKSEIFASFTCSDMTLFVLSDMLNMPVFPMKVQPRCVSINAKQEINYFIFSVYYLSATSAPIIS